MTSWQNDVAPICCFGGKDLAQEMNTLGNFSLREILKNFFEEKSFFWDQQVGLEKHDIFSIDKYLQLQWSVTCTIKISTAVINLAP